MKADLKKTLISKINASAWWHVPAMDPDAYKKRGRFLASTYAQASFYGRPNDIPEKVYVFNPICGTSELEILKVLFPTTYSGLYANVCREDNNWYERRIDLDSKICARARDMGHDAIALLAKNGKRYLLRNRKPHSIELNLINP